MLNCSYDACYKLFEPSAHPANARRQRFCSSDCQVRAHAQKSGYRYREKHPERVKAARAVVAARIKATLQTAKDRPCMDCGNRFPSCCMDFDHVRGKKTMNIGHDAWSRGLKAVLAEIEKCDVVCSNCHRIRTFITRRTV